MKLYRFLGKRGRTTIPLPMRIRNNITDNEFVSFEDQEDGSIIIRRESVCDSEECTHAFDSITVYDILNALTEQEKKAALVHLSMALADCEGHHAN